MPMAFFLPLLFKKQSKFKNFVITNVLIVLCIEITQLLTASGSCDIDDIILNTLGGMCGYLLYRLIERIKDKLPNIFKTEGFINFFVILILIIGILYLFDVPVIEWLS